MNPIPPTQVPRRFAGQLLFVWLAVVFVCFRAQAAECDIPQDKQETFVGVYAEWPGLPDGQSRHFEQMLLDHLSNHAGADDSLFFCTITKAMFPALGAENLFNVVSIKKMLNNTTELAGKETFSKKLQNFKVQHLVFIKVERALARYTVVPVDASGTYPKASFVIDFVEPFEERVKKEFFDKVAHGVKRVSQPAVPPEFPVIITCFVDNIREAAQPGWRMDEQVVLIPKKLSNKLWKDKPYFQTFFPVRFEDRTCPFKDDDRKAFQLKYQDRWFAWTGTISLRGTMVYVAIDFVHLNIPPWPAEWKRDGTTVNMDRLHEELAAAIASEWEAYVKVLRAKRSDLPQIEDYN
jgi:hypothetical protein